MTLIQKQVSIDGTARIHAAVTAPIKEAITNGAVKERIVVTTNDATKWDIDITLILQHKEMIPGKTPKAVADREGSRTDSDRAQCVMVNEK